MQVLAFGGFGWHRDFFPPFSGYYATCGYNRYAVGAGYLNMGKPSTPEHLPHECNVHCGYPFVNALRGFGDVMFWVAAQGVIATVKDAILSWVDSSRQVVGDAVSKEHLVSNANTPVSIDLKSLPRPAFVISLNQYFAPKPFLFLAGHGWNRPENFMTHGSSVLGLVGELK